MAKIIVYLEDDAYMRNHTADLLRELFNPSEYIVETFQRIDQVKEYFPQNKEQIICVITDLNMSDEWLDEYRNETDGGILSGWVWLQRYVYINNPNVLTVIYSGYISDLKLHLQSKGRLSMLSKKNIICVGKGDRDGEGFPGLMEKLTEILHIDRV